ncbi:hypothetical protein V6N11_029562 [Hibiscus sabdariffa]|uniref:Uncharacterized protein n=1 Tax=Hibiscus sabdariffa TaxID=183260 RepID=A0ABR2P724_9ROSI
MAKIALVIVLISMIMIFSVQSVVGDVAASSAATTNVNQAVGSVPVASEPAKDDAKGKSSSWTDWTKKKISGIESNIEKFFSTSSSPGSALAPAPATTVTTTTTTATANKV